MGLAALGEDLKPKPLALIRSVSPGSAPTPGSPDTTALLLSGGIIRDYDTHPLKELLMVAPGPVCVCVCVYTVGRAPYSWFFLHSLFPCGQCKPG